MTELKPGNWYYSKKGYLCRVDSLLDNGNILITSHYTGNKITIAPDQAETFTPAPAPTIPPGTAMLKDNHPKSNNYDKIYKKYPHIVKGSIYSIQSTNTPINPTIKIGGKIRIKKNKSAKGATRCKIRCQTPGCKNIRDIKVQDAFQVTCCLECKRIKKKENLKKFLKKV